MKPGSNPHMLQLMREAARHKSTWQPLQAVLYSNNGIHVAIMAEPFLSDVLKGSKTIESRFSRHKIAPYHQVQKGDLVLMKRPAGPVVACFRAGEVEYIDLQQSPLSEVRRRHGAAIGGDEAFGQVQIPKRYATLIPITDLHILEAISLSKRDPRGWVKLQ
jgi:ASCH domain